MNQSEVEFHQLLNIFAANSRVSLTPVMLRVYDKSVQSYGYDSACKALETLLMETKSWTMPTPQMIVAKIINAPSENSEANEVSGRIIEAVTRFGHASGNSARSYIGELGWNVVQRFGGWSTLCEGLGVTMQVSTTRAQLRDMALSLIDIAKKRDLTEAPQLPTTQNEQLGGVVKLLSEKKEMPK